MAKVINCDCGFVVQGADDAELVANAKAHAREVHAYEMTDEEALSLALPA
jgi:predicted small metal-binding protein